MDLVDLFQQMGHGRACRDGVGELKRQLGGHEARPQPGFNVRVGFVHDERVRTGRSNGLQQFQVVAQAAPAPHDRGVIADLTWRQNANPALGPPKQPAGIAGAHIVLAELRLADQRPQLGGLGGQLGWEPGGLQDVLKVARPARIIVDAAVVQHER